LIVALLLASLVILGGLFLAVLLGTARARGQLALRGEAVGLGAATNFFDTLGIGSFAPTIAYLRLRRLVPDRFIPATLNVGHCLPTVVQALIFVNLVRVDPLLLAACIAAAVAGAVVGTSVVLRLPTRSVQAVIGVALLVAAAVYALTNLGLLPGGGDALSLGTGRATIAITAHLVLGALMTFGIGLYAPSLILLSLLGLSPIAAFPIMMGACAFLMPIAGLRFLRSEHIDLRVVLGIVAGGIPAVLLAALVVKSLPLDALRWGVVAIVTYSAVMLLRTAVRTPRQPHAAVASKSSRSPDP
jgi:uncharacterized membrane protein YfcA